MKSKRDVNSESQDRGVSPVIGVILMVAITVILAAVIAAFVLDIGPGEANPQAAIDISGEDTSEAEVTLNSLDNADGVAVIIFDGELNNNNTKFDTMSVSGDSITVAEDEGEFNDDFDGSSAEVTVVAYEGNGPDADHSNVDEMSEDGNNVAILERFDVEGDS